MNSSSIESVTLWECPDCGSLAPDDYNTNECINPSDHYSILVSRKSVVFVRADQVVRELERLAADFEGAMEVALDREYPDLANAYEIAAAKTLTLATQLQGETNG